MKRTLQVFFILSAVLLLPPILRSNATYEVGSVAATTHFPVPVASQASSSKPEGTTPSPTKADLAVFVHNEAETMG